VGEIGEGRYQERLHCIKQRASGEILSEHIIRGIYEGDSSYGHTILIPPVPLAFVSSCERKCVFIVFKWASKSKIIFTCQEHFSSKIIHLAYHAT